VYCLCVYVYCGYPVVVKYFISYHNVLWIVMKCTWGKEDCVMGMSKNSCQWRSWKVCPVSVYYVLYPRVKWLGHRLLHFVKLWLKDACLRCLACTDVCIATWRSLRFNFSHWNTKGSSGSDTLLEASRLNVVIWRLALLRIPKFRCQIVAPRVVTLSSCGFAQFFFAKFGSVGNSRLGQDRFHPFYRSLLVGHPVIRCLWVLNHSLLTC
jgi:hypothetical protein